MDTVRRVEAFLLSREWFDTDNGVEIVLWARADEGPVRVRIPRQEAVMFVPREVGSYAHRRAERPLTTFDGRPVDALYFRSQRALRDERDRLRAAMYETLESDVKPSDRFVMERFVTGGMSIEGPCTERRGILHFDGARVKAVDMRPRLSLLSLDIETDDLDGPLLSAALATADHERVIVRGEPGIPDERALLRAFFAEIVAIDPDVLCGWNVVEFDLAVLETRARALGVPFTVGRGGERARIVPPSGGIGRRVRSPLLAARSSQGLRRARRRHGDRDGAEPGWSRARLGARPPS